MPKKGFTFYLPSELVDKVRGLVGYGRPYTSLSDAINVALEHELEQYTTAQIAHWEYIPEDNRVFDVPSTQLGPPIVDITDDEYTKAMAIVEAYKNDEIELGPEVREASKLVSLWHDQDIERNRNDV